MRNINLPESTCLQNSNSIRSLWVEFSLFHWSWPVESDQKRKSPKSENHNVACQIKLNLFIKLNFFSHFTSSLPTWTLSSSNIRMRCLFSEICSDVNRNHATLTRWHSMITPLVDEYGLRLEWERKISSGGSYFTSEEQRRERAPHPPLCWDHPNSRAECVQNACFKLMMLS